MGPVVVDASSAISEIEMWHSGNLAVAFCHTRGGRTAKSWCQIARMLHFILKMLTENKIENKLFLCQREMWQSGSLAAGSGDLGCVHSLNA